MKKNLVFVIKATQDFVRYVPEEIEKNYVLLNKLCDSISTIYIPLLNMLEELENKNVSFRIGLVLPPVLCALLDNDIIKEYYVNSLNDRIALGEKEVERLASEPDVLENAKSILINYKKLLFDYTEKYNRNLIKKFAAYNKKGSIELLACAGTDFYVPHYADMPEIISAQVETGLLSYRRYFGENPEGFWLTDCGYAKGVDRILKSYGFSYTILNYRSFLLADNIPSGGIFAPVRTPGILAAFSSYTYFDEMLYGENGYSANPVYKNLNRDIGFDSELENLEPVCKEGYSRINTGYHYNNKNFRDDKHDIYNFDCACEQVKADAESFLKVQSETLSKAGELLADKDFVYSLCTIDAEKISQEWAEFIDWLKTVIENASSYDLNVTSCNTMTDAVFKFEKFEPFCASAAGDGYGENLLSSKNSWMMRYIRKACERIVDLSNRFLTDTGLKTRLLNMGAKELMLAQSTGLAKMIDNGEFEEYAEKRFKDSIINFTTVFDSLGSNVVSTEWLTTLEVKDNLFPWMNYKIFSKKV